jgi:hypothetical protein
MDSKYGFMSLFLPSKLDFFYQHIEFNAANRTMSPSWKYVKLDCSPAVVWLVHVAAGSIVAHFSYKTL